MVQVNKNTYCFMFDDLPLNQEQTWFDIWIQHIKTVGKTLSFSNSFTPTHQKLISNQLYSSDKMMVQVTKTLIILCLMIFHSTKMKNDLIFGFSTSKQLETTPFSNSYAHRPETISQPTFTAVTKWWFNQQKHIIFYVWWYSTQPKANMIWYLDSAHQNNWKVLSFSNSYAYIH